MEKNDTSSKKFSIDFDYKGEAVSYEVWPEPANDGEPARYRLINDEKFISFMWEDGGRWTADKIYDQDYIDMVGKAIASARK